MNMQRFVIAVACTGFGANALAGGVNLYSQDFESPIGYSTSTLSPAPGGFLGHFDRTAVAVDAFYNYANTTGSFMTGMFDFGLPAPFSTVTTDSIDITNMTNLQFAVDLAAGETFSFDAFSQMSLNIEYQIDGGMWTGMMSVDPIVGFPSIFGADNAPDGSPITNFFTTFNTDIAGTGNDLLIRATWESGGLFEYIGLDNILVTGDNNVNVVPLPPAAFGGLAMLAGLGAYRRVRR